MHAVQRVDALLLEGGVADGEHLVDEQDVGVELHEDGEREADLHPRRVVLQAQVDEVLELRELDRRVKASPRLRGAEPEHDGVDDDVLARGEVGVEADAELDEGAHAPAHADRAAVDAVDPGDALHQRALAAAVAPGDAEELPFADLEVDVLQRVQLFELAVADRVKDPFLDREGGFARDPNVFETPSTMIVGCTGEAVVTGRHTTARRGLSAPTGRYCARQPQRPAARERTDAASPRRVSERQADPRRGSRRSRTGITRSRSGRASSTPGINNSATRSAQLGLAARYDGLRVLDIGARDGYFSFELERRGAEVVAIDYMDPAETGFPSRASCSDRASTTSSTTSTTSAPSATAPSTSSCSSASCTTCATRCWRWTASGTSAIADALLVLETQILD